jgi:hypothetical protein
MNKPITDSIVSAHRGKALGSIWEVCKDVKQDILQEQSISNNNNKGLT